MNMDNKLFPTGWTLGITKNAILRTCGGPPTYQQVANSYLLIVLASNGSLLVIRDLRNWLVEAGYHLPTLYSLVYTLPNGRVQQLPWGTQEEVFDELEHYGAVKATIRFYQ